MPSSKSPAISRTNSSKQLHGHLTIQTHIFLTGATGESHHTSFTLISSEPLNDLLLLCSGYIGGSVLTRLLSHPHSDAFQTTVLVRSESKAKQFRSMGVKAIVGSYSDLDLLRKHAGQADVIIACVRHHTTYTTSSLLMSQHIGGRR